MITLEYIYFTPKFPSHASSDEARGGQECGEATGCARDLEEQRLREGLPDVQPCRKAQ